MKFDFETQPSRTEIGNLKDFYTPDPMKQAGYLSMNGAEMDFKTAPVIRRLWQTWQKTDCLDLP